MLKCCLKRICSHSVKKYIYIFFCLLFKTMASTFSESSLIDLPELHIVACKVGKKIWITRVSIVDYLKVLMLWKWLPGIWIHSWDSDYLLWSVVLAMLLLALLEDRYDIYIFPVIGDLPRSPWLFREKTKEKADSQWHCPTPSVLLGASYCALWTFHEHMNGQTA